MQVFDITVVAGSPFTVGAPGRYIKYMSGSNGGGDASISITPGHATTTKITLQPGQAYRVADDAKVPDSWTIANYAGGATILGKVVVGNGRIDDSTVSGTVQVVDGGKTRSLSNSAFGSSGIIAAVAGQYARIQLWNPAANTKRLVVEAVTVWSATASNVYLTPLAAPLTTLLNAGQAKRLDGSNSSGLIYADTNAVVSYAGALASYPVVSGQVQAFKLNEPVIIPPGYGLTGVGNVVNANMQMNFEWYEEPNV